MRTSTVKSLAALALTGAGSALIIGFQVPDTPVVAATSATISSATASTAAATAAPSTSTTAVASAATYADGTWTGQAVQEPWGTFQVQAIVSGGRVTDVVIVSSPQDDHSSRINSQAIPLLTQAAVAAQSADVDMISGATWTSQSYATSLQAALDQAKSAAQTATETAA